MGIRIETSILIYPRFQPVPKISSDESTNNIYYVGTGDPSQLSRNTMATNRNENGNKKKKKERVAIRMKRYRASQPVSRSLVNYNPSSSGGRLHSCVIAPGLNGPRKCGAVI